MLLFTAVALPAQLKYGFKTGLNFARISGPSENSSAGANLESWKTLTGFHIGLSLGYKIDEYFSVRGELLYTKRGGKYTFDGESYRIFNADGNSVLTTGTSRYLINVNNAYLDLPVTFSGRWKDLELTVGGYAGLLIQSVGDGSLIYSCKTALNNPVPNPNKPDEKLEFNLDYNYRKDDPGAGGEGTSTVTATVDGKIVQLPKTIGAYYDYPEDKGNLYNSLDYGLVAGMSYYLSRSLFISARIQYGLADITNNDADISKNRTANGATQLLYQSDTDRNVVIQVSVGFSF